MISFHPFKKLKTFLPKTLLGRSLIILIAPVLLIQGITTYVFVDRHLTKTTELLAQNIAGNISASRELFSKEEEHRVGFAETTTTPLASFVQKHFHLTMVVKTPSGRAIVKSENSLLEGYLERYLQKKIDAPFQIFVEEPLTQIHLYLPQHELVFTFETKRLFSKTTEILLWWALGTPILFLFIAILFLRNQVRPLRRLSEVVEAFGKGQEEEEHHPSGAQEIRKVTEAFNEMRARIRRQIEQRTHMLAGVSHDLRTPLARMSLQLAVMPETEDTKALQEDLREMEEMLTTYLAFARGEGEEATKKVSLQKLVEAVTRGINREKVSITLPKKEIQLRGRENALKRCLSNLIENGIRYAPHVWIKATASENDVCLILDDDGPGIPKSQQEEVFKPFIRLEESRNTETGGTGLGLSIARDIAHSHGGDILLKASSKGGLRVCLILPL